MNHPVLSSKVYVPIMEKLPKVETLGEVRKRRSTTDKSQKEGSVATPKDLSDKKSLGETKKPCPHKIEITRNKAAAKKDDSAKSENNSAKTLTSKKVTDKNESSGKTANDTNRPSSAKKEPNKNSSDVKKKPESSESVLSTTSEVKTISKDKRPSIAGPSSKSTGGVKSDKPRQISPLRKRSPNRRTSISPKRMRKTRSPRKRSNSPRKHSPSHLRRSPRRSPLRRSPVSGRFARSPLRITYKRSPVRSPHRSPIRKSPRRSPARRSPFRRSPLRRSPLRRSPLSRRAISPRRRSPLLRRSISPRRRSPIRRQGSPRRRSRSPLSRRLASPRRSPLRRSPIRSSSPRRRSPLMKSYCSNRSPPRRSISPRYQSRSPRNRRDRTPDRDFFQGQSPLPFKREGNVVVVDEDAIQNSSNPQISQTHAQSEEFLSRFNFSSNSSNPIQTNKPGSFPDTTTGNIYQRGGIFATSAKRKTTSFESDLLKRGRVESYSGDPMKVARPVKKNENFWESWHKSHDEEQAEIEQPMQEDIWTKQQSNWTETSTDARGVGLNRQILGRDSISVTVFNKENPNILINKHDGSYRGSNPVNPTAEEIWHQQVELASASRQSVLPQMSRNAGMEWMQNKEKQSFQQSLISDLLSKKEQYHNLGGPSLAPGSQSLGNLGYARMNPRSTGGLDSSESLTIGNWNNMAGGSFLGHMNSIPLNTVSSLTDSWQNPDRSVLPSAAANPVQSSSRFGIVKTGTSSSVHPLAAIGFAGGGLEITGGNSSSIGTGGIISSMRGESSVKSQDKNQRWNALSARSIPGSSNVIGNQQGRNFGAGSIRMPGKQDGNNDSKVVGQDSWRSNIGPGMGHLQQPWRAQQQVEAVPQAPQEDLNAVAQKLNSTLTRILNNYKPTGGLFSNPSLKHGIGGLQQRPDQEMFRPGPIGDKLSLAQNIASALTSMGMVNVPQHDLVAILQYLGLLGGGGQGMMPSGNRVMDDLRETVSRFERTFQYHRF